ncbi:YceI family protein [Aurantibacter sp.]|uniref:YceI family protein n=1 Tax=Aurantibacter sp. TaxID=2807103 RepID=UPI0035C87879
MKKTILKGFTIIALGLVVTSCKNDTKTSEITEAEIINSTNQTESYKVDDNSLLVWKANKIIGGHEGTFNVAGGTVNIKDNTLVDGNFNFNIGSLKCTDIPEESEGNSNLVNHLLNEDFFDVVKFPTAKFEITKVEGSRISGNLTLKEITKNISFDVKVVVSNNTVTITSDTFTIDRTEWNISHNSGKIMDAAKLGDYLIKDDVELKINVTANKA